MLEAVRLVDDDTTRNEPLRDDGGIHDDLLKRHIVIIAQFAVGCNV